MIISSIELKENYRNAKPTKLGQLSDINYLVGINAAGKSSLLWAIYSKLKREKIYDNEIPDMDIHFSIEGHSSRPTQYIDLGQNNLPNHPVSQVHGEQYVGKNTHHLDPMTDSGFYLTKTVRAQTGATSVEYKDVEESKQGRIGKESKIKLFTQDNFGNEIPFNHVTHKSSGQHVLISLQNPVLDFMRNDKEKMKIFLIEEPENSLHPSLQKEIPAILNDFVAKAKANDKTLQFIITTHSPFIISAARQYDNQKVYEIEKGEIKTTANIGEDLRFAQLAQMLGAEPTDIGLPKNICLVEESSICKILKACQNKPVSILKKNWEFISCGNWERTTKFSERIDNLRVYKTLFSCHLLYMDTFHIITDHISNKEKETKKSSYDQLMALKNDKHGNKRYHELTRAFLEDYYPNIENEGKQIHEEYKKASEGKQWPESNRIKNEFAEQIAGKINTKEDFQKLFDHELNFLLES